ncbi:MAG: carboxymuconolactone decarboxylase family protein [Bryobacteraceae bacterium]|nr:carboxymuconolactone decarboxylase family protein [Bryobacteraceae bacterium]
MANLLTLQTRETAPAAAVPVLDKIQKTFGFTPNLMATFANSPAVLEGYLALDAHFEKTAFTPVERQIILLAASVENRCGYCIAAHSTIAKGFLHAEAGVVAAVRAGQSTGDAKIDALVALTREIVEKRGFASEATIAAFVAAGYKPAQAMELLLGVALKTISNYLDHFNPAPLDAQFANEAVKN